MSSAIPAILDAIETRLKAISGIKNVYRVLQGRAHPSDAVSDLPAIALRVTSDSIDTAQAGKARVTLNLDIEALIVADDAFSDAILAGWVWAIRSALGVDETPALDGLLRQGTGIEWQTALYGYPDPSSAIALARQPIILHLIEQY